MRFGWRGSDGNRELSVERSSTRSCRRCARERLAASCASQAREVSMKIYSWNVNGIRAVLKKGTFQSFITEHQPDVLCLQETKAERDQIEIDLPGYHEYWNSAVKKGYSGTAILCKEKPVNVINGFPEQFAKKFKFADELQRDSTE